MAAKKKATPKVDPIVDEVITEIKDASVTNNKNTEVEAVDALYNNADVELVEETVTDSSDGEPEIINDISVPDISSYDEAPNGTDDAEHDEFVPAADVTEDPVIETKPEVVKPEVHDFDIKVGDAVKLVDDCVANVTGVAIPMFAHKNVYKVRKILADRVVIVCGTLTYGVKFNDVIKVN